MILNSNSDHNYILRIMRSTSTVTTGVITPNALYHTVLTVAGVADVADDSTNTSIPTRCTCVLGTHGTLETAKSYALRLLEERVIIPDYFDAYTVRPNEEISVENRAFNNTVLVSAHLSAGRILIISMHSTPNTESLGATPEGQLVLPKGAKFLHYVLHTTTKSTSTEATGSPQIKGAYVHRADAWSAAHKLLDRKKYIKYSDRSDAEFWYHWPYDEEVIVHAVSDDGQNHYVSVRMLFWADVAQKRGLENLFRLSLSPTCPQYTQSFNKVA